MGTNCEGISEDLQICGSLTAGLDHSDLSLCILTILNQIGKTLGPLGDAFARVVHFRRRVP